MIFENVRHLASAIHVARCGLPQGVYTTLTFVEVARRAKTQHRPDGYRTGKLAFAVLESFFVWQIASGLLS